MSPLRCSSSWQARRRLADTSSSRLARREPRRAFQLPQRRGSPASPSPLCRFSPAGLRQPRPRQGGNFVLPPPRPLGSAGRVPGISPHLSWRRLGAGGVPSPAPRGAPRPLRAAGAAGWPSTAGEQGRGGWAVSDAAVGSRAPAGQRELVTAAGGFRLLGCLGEPDTKRKLLPRRGDPCLRGEYLPWEGRRGQGGPGWGAQGRAVGLGRGGAPRFCPLAARRHPNPPREGAKGWGEQARPRGQGERLPEEPRGLTAPHPPRRRMRSPAAKSHLLQRWPGVQSSLAQASPTPAARLLRPRMLGERGQRTDEGPRAPSKRGFGI